MWESDDIKINALQLFITEDQRANYNRFKDMNLAMIGVKEPKEMKPVQLVIFETVVVGF